MKRYDYKRGSLLSASVPSFTADTNDKVKMVAAAVMHDLLNIITNAEKHRVLEIIGAAREPVKEEEKVWLRCAGYFLSREIGRFDEEFITIDAIGLEKVKAEEARSNILTDQLLTTAQRFDGDNVAFTTEALQRFLAGELLIKDSWQVERYARAAEKGNVPDSKAAWLLSAKWLLCEALEKAEELYGHINTPPRSPGSMCVSRPWVDWEDIVYTGY